jgi:predicted aldo/keto reductase-like oxidoreductase
LLEEREKGNIRNLGWSYHGDVAVFDYLLATGIKWDFAMIQMNYIDWQNADNRNANAEYLYEELVKHNVPVVIMEPLLGGRLVNLNAQCLSVINKIHAEDTPAKWAFRYAGTPENVLTVLSGMVCMEHLQENVETYSPLKPLNAQEYRALENVTTIFLNSDYIKCTECQYCMPCPYGLDIPGIFACYNKYITERNNLTSLQGKEYKKWRRAFLIEYDKTIQKDRQASHCIHCNKCVTDCPQKINIPDEMSKIDKYIEKLRNEK